jgi:polar amino acid transport system substrate-binding protein
MKNIFLICLLIVLHSQFSFAADKRVLITSLETPPYSGEKLTKQGGSIEIIKEAFSRVGYKTKIKFYPWKRAIEAAKRGNSDGVGPLWYTKERTEWFLYSKRLQTPSLIGFFKQKNRKFQLKEHEDLRRHAVGYVLGYAYSKELYTNITHSKGYSFYTPYDLFSAMIKGKIDLAVLGKRVGEYLLNTNFPEISDKYHFTGPVIETREQYLAISKKAKDSQIKLSDFNTGLEIIRKDGSLKKILTRHGIN